MQQFVEWLQTLDCFESLRLVLSFLYFQNNQFNLQNASHIDRMQHYWRRLCHSLWCSMSEVGFHLSDQSKSKHLSKHQDKTLNEFQLLNCLTICLNSNHSSVMMLKRNSESQETDFQILQIDLKNWTFLFVEKTMQEYWILNSVVRTLRTSSTALNDSKTWNQYSRKCLKIVGQYHQAKQESSRTSKIGFQKKRMSDTLFDSIVIKYQNTKKRLHHWLQVYCKHSATTVTNEWQSTWLSFLFRFFQSLIVSCESNFNQFFDFFFCQWFITFTTSEQWNESSFFDRLVEDFSVLWSFWHCIDSSK